MSGIVSELDLTLGFAKVGELVIDLNELGSTALGDLSVGAYIEVSCPYQAFVEKVAPNALSIY